MAYILMYTVVTYALVFMSIVVAFGIPDYVDYYCLLHTCYRAGMLRGVYLLRGVYFSFELYDHTCPAMDVWKM